MSIFSERLKFLRKEKKLTQTELAKMLNTTQGTVGKWENNKLEPNFKKLILLAKYLDVSTDYLLGVTNIKGERSIMFSFFKRDKEKEV
ncbi:helix-turn-helix domain-containing protein [Lactococcus raffinolactis]|uniref:helix-turn-helix domain-containing protein n=1 Tax=Pseudolactococcus raffinolactis TaxID=1366 RepID=UPI0014368517|nr:helix-turn-helix transcriptional regulator [Lactococcus raffinolactis]QIW50414.1 helix-turn-helix domain-containing protein [Lactococcus raffinolactis]